MHLSVREKMIVALAFAGIVLSTLLVLNEMELRGYNPALNGVPSCHIYANGFILIILSVFIINPNLKRFLFISGVTLGAAVSLYFSVTHLLMINMSPSFYNISVSYVTTALFILSFLAKYLVIKR